jgi:hypothetical protein
VSVFYDEVMAWAAKRHAGPQLTHYTQAPKAMMLMAPPTPPEDNVVLDGDDDEIRFNLISTETLCKDRLQFGRPFLNWRRPPNSKMDKSRRLLATGRCADEEEDTGFIAISDPTRGFP